MTLLPLMMKFILFYISKYNKLLIIIIVVATCTLNSNIIIIKSIN